MRFVTDPKQAREVKVRDGTTYPVSPGGSFVVTDAGHLEEMERGNEDYYAKSATFGGRGVLCACGHVAWPWQRECPKCAQPLP